MYLKDLESFVDESQNLLNLYLVKIRQLSLTDFLFEFTRGQNIFISCNNITPFVAKNVDKTTFPPGGELHSFALDTRRLLGGKLINIEILNRDLVLALTFSRKDHYFKEEMRTLIVELIASHPNAFVLNENNEILTAYRYSYDVTTGGRLLRRGIPYELPRKSAGFNDFLASNEQFYEAYLKRDAEFIQKQNYREIFIFLELKIKQKERLLNNLEQDSKKAELAELYYEAANYLLTEQKDYREDYFIYQEKRLPYSPHRSLYDNSNLLFKKGRKLKRSQSVIRDLQSKTEDELTYYKTLFNQMLTASNADELEEIRKELAIQPKKETRSKKFSKTAPYFFNYSGATVMFGKNNRQNDFLTFKVANGNDLFFHIKNQSGAHVIVRGDASNVDLTKLGAETVLALARLEDGEVIYTQVKYVQKGRLPGLVKLVNYKSVYLRNVREEITLLTKKALRL